MKQSLPTSAELQDLYDHMIDIATRLDYYGGFGPWGAHGVQLAGAAGVVSTWVDGMKDQEAAT